MNDTLFVAVIESFCDLFDVSCRFWFCESLLLLETLVELALWRVFHDDIDVGGVIKVSKESENVCMTKMNMDFDLPSQLLSHLIVFADGTEADDLERDDFETLFLAHLEDLAKVSMSNLLSNFKVLKRPSRTLSFRDH